ncbi:MAG: YjbH domain-containing protein [Rikenellaceae bacterium]|nr:YjbH domain-containing protein [Rikenellaceae bacterium]
MIKKIGLLILLIYCPCLLFAQTTLGTTGLLLAPSAEMQRDGTVMLGANFLNDVFTPPQFPYNTINYYLNATLLPFLEVAYTATMFRATDNPEDPSYIYFPKKKGRFINQDRSVSVRLRLLRERKYIPAVVIGTNDCFHTSNGGFMVSQFFSRIYVAMSKDFYIRNQRLTASLAYIYHTQNRTLSNSISAGVAFSPSFARNLNVIAEYCDEQCNIGANYLLFNHLFAQVMLQRCKYFSGGLTYKIYLKKESFKAFK